MAVVVAVDQVVPLLVVVEIHHPHHLVELLVLLMEIPLVLKHLIQILEAGQVLQPPLVLLLQTIKAVHLQAIMVLVAVQDQEADLVVAQVQVLVVVVVVVVAQAQAQALDLALEVLKNAMTMEVLVVVQVLVRDQVQVQAQAQEVALDPDKMVAIVMPSIPN